MSNRGGRGRGGYQQDGGGGRGRGGPPRGGHGGGGRGRGSEVRWGTQTPLDEPPRKPGKGKTWKYPQELPEDPIEVKQLMPSFTPGELSSQQINVLTNHWLLNITIPRELFRYDVTVEVEKLYDDGAGLGRGRGRVVEPVVLGAGGGGDPGQDPQAQPESRVNKDILKKLVQLLLIRIRQDWTAANPQSADEFGVITDFSRLVVSNRRLLNNSLQKTIPHSDLRGEDDAKINYHLTLAPATFTVQLDTVRDIINSRGMIDHPDLFEIKQIFNILMKNIGDPDIHVPMGRASLLRISDPTDYNYLGYGLMNWKGASLICTLGATWKPFLNVDVQNSAILIGQSVLKAIGEIFIDPRAFRDASTHNPSRNMEKACDVRQWSNRDYDDVMALLKSCKVRRKVRGENRDSRLDGIHGFGAHRSSGIANEIMFDFQGRNMSVGQYFLRVVGQPLRYPNAPVLVCGKAFIPAEFCTIKEGQSINRLLPPNPQSRMLTQCTEKPHEKHHNITTTAADLHLHNHPLLNSFGVKLPQQGMFKCEKTRVLPPPVLCYGTDNNNNPQNPLRGRLLPRDGVWDMWGSSAQFYTPAQIESWAFVYIGGRLNEQGISTFANMLMEEGHRRGMHFPQDWELKQVQIRREDDHDSSVRKLVDTFQYLQKGYSDSKRSRSIIICIIPPKPSQQYCQVKQAAERIDSASVLTQCVQEKIFQKCIGMFGPKGPDYSVTRNLLLKINAKMGGINHVPMYPEPIFADVSILRVPTLILGIDVTHPSLPIQGRPTGYPSFASVTGSLDRSGMPYMMHVQAQIREGNKAIGAAEVVERLDLIVTEMLKKFRARSGARPQRLIVFRDGVGDSQFPEILQREMQDIRRACSSLSPSYKPPITFIAVQKRHKVRFFVEQNGRVSQDNIPPGTVVDKDIVSNADFYLLSHKGQLGTSRPTHYHILWDDSDFSFDEIQGLAYFLCYNYSRCNRSVSYPAPTYYAHWAALRAKELASGYRDWTGEIESLQRLQANLQRSPFITEKFPMHFI